MARTSICLVAWLCALGACAAEPSRDGDSPITDGDPGVGAAPGDDSTVAEDGIDPIDAGMALDPDMTRDAGGVVASRPAPQPEAMGDARVWVGNLCDRGYDELVVDRVCGSAGLALRSLQALQQALGLVPDRRDVTAGYVLTGHSTALSARSVSSVNPRVIFTRFADPPRGQEMFALAFVRGEQTVEMVVRDRITEALRFYLLSYEQACNAEPDGCNAGDLLTPSTESGWRNLVLRDDEDLKNTSLDCRTCHQPDGPGTPKVLRMQELGMPWTHWFDRLMAGGVALLDDYLAMKDGEDFAGLSPARIRHTNAAALEGFMRRESPLQTNEFPSGQIESEVARSTADAGVMQPIDNSIPGKSETWQVLYEAAKRGETITVPYHDVKVTDPDKLARATEAYRSYLQGELAADDLPDFRDIYPDDPQVLAEMGFTTEPGLDAEGVLLQACAQCHNRKLDQSISRARFVADLTALDAKQKAEAIKRLRLPPDDPRAMPPASHRTLRAEVREQLVEALR